MYKFYINLSEIEKCKKKMKIYIQKGSMILRCSIKFIIASVIIISQSIILYSQILDKPYLAPSKDYTPQIYKYIFTQLNENTTPKQDSQETKPKKIQSILNDTASAENSMNVNYDNSREITGLTVKVKDKDKKISISIYNLIGNKVADVYNKPPGSSEVEITEFKDTIDKLSNGVYICVLQGNNFRLMEKFTISR